METCGPYKIIFETGSGDGWASFLGRDERGEVLITVFTSGAPVGRQIIELQQRASAASPHVASVIESGECEWGEWYSTRSYPRSLGKLLEGRVELSRAWLLQLLLGVTRGALAFKSTCGRSHGNLHSHNVLLGGTTNIKEAEMVIKDPLGGESADAQEIERRDLKAIGMTLYQLVRRREVDERSMILPLEVSPEWKTRFGKDAERWVSLCNRLLDPGLSLETYSLEQLEHDLVAFEPKAAVSRKQLVVAAVVLLAAGIVGLGVNWWSKQATLEVTSNLPGVKVSVKSGDKVIESFEVQNKVKTVRVRKGNSYIVEGRRDDFAAGTNLLVGARKQPVPLQFQFGTLNITGLAGGATKYSTNLYVVPGPVRHDIVVPGYQVEEVREQKVAAGQVIDVVKELKPTARGEVRIEITAVPRTATIEVRDPGGSVIKKDQQFWQKDLAPGRYTVLVTYEVVTQTNEIDVGDSPQKLRFEVPTRELKLLAEDSMTGAPVTADISYRGKKIGDTKDSILWPIGTWEFALSASGYETVRQNVEVKTDALAQRPIKLIQILAEVAVRSDPPIGVRFGTNSTQLSSVPTTVLLPPGTNILYAHHDDLGWITNRLVLVRGKTNAELIYLYGRVKLTANLSNVTVSISPLNRRVNLRPEAMLVLPPATYSFEAVYFAAQPPLTNKLEAVKVDPREVPRPVHFNFAFAKVKFASSPELGADVYDERWVPMGIADDSSERIVPLGKRTYYFVGGKDKRTNKVSAELLTLGPETIKCDLSKPPGFTTPFGMEFVWVEHLTNYVGISEVTQSQYETVVTNNPSVGRREPGYPVNSVTYNEALRFCALLRTKAPPPDNYDYRLPTEQQWKGFVGTAWTNDALAVIKTNNPARVGSKGRNEYELYDVRGNVFEWVLGGAAIGSGYSSPRLATDALFLRKALPAIAAEGNFKDSEIGFRVILAPRPPAAVAAGRAQ